MRRLSSIFFVCLWVLGACGVNESIPLERSPSTDQTNHVVYPTPVEASLQATSTTRKPLPPIAPTHVPTIVIEPTIPAPVFERVKTLNLAPMTGPNYLIGWSPDGAYILYTQGGTEPDTAALYMLDSTTGEQTLIDSAVVSGKQSTVGYHMDFAAPQWLDRCCALVLARPKPNHMQEVLLVDPNGQVQETFGIYDRGLFSLEHAGTLVTVNAQGIKQSYGTRARIDIPDFANGDILASFTLSHHGKGAYLADSKTMTVIDLNDPSQDWNISINELDQTRLTQKNISLSSLRIQGVTWSPDGRKLAFWLSSSTFHELWIVNADGGDLENRYVLEQSRGGVLAWSPDNTMIAFTSTDTGSNPTTTLNVFSLLGDTAVLIDSGIYYNPIWNKSSHFIASTLENNTSIAIYTIKN